MYTGMKYCDLLDLRSGDHRLQGTPMISLVIDQVVTFFSLTYHMYVNSLRVMLAPHKRA